MSERDTTLPIRAATEVLAAHGIVPDRCEILQNGHTLVLRLTEDLVARVVQDVDGPRQGTEWFARENAIAQHLTEQGAPVIPLHAALPPGPHEHLGYPMNFWKFVTAIKEEPKPEDIGSTLYQCHEVLRTCTQPLPKLAIITESAALLDALEEKNAFPTSTLELLRAHLLSSLQVLGDCPHQVLHGDAHMGNLMNTTVGLLWADWEDTFAGPVEWDVASIIWNAKLLEEDHDTVNGILAAYRDAGGRIDENVLHQSLIARAAVMTAWYPVLYPNPNAERQRKLQLRIEWLEKMR
ncbi:phosphotransferase [Roseimicrobium sp. ORNL1]|uniref:phosphotransferase family protein n=1 Tax=Roseimicrobium sp. ORNL1 TaxID=2711231 RepID=UPI0013E1CD9B|nr:phosphotransferase [Roseimicrobium sp. ORNL1]QIF00060.1 phosphotransferase [Roseimicrobium sp. ORNL1]